MRTVVAICTLADVALIAAGTAGAGAVIRRADWVLDAVRYAGAAFLLGYAALAARRSVRVTNVTAQSADIGTRSGRAIVAPAGSALWFSAIGFGAQRLGRSFDRPLTWRILDAFVAVVMTRHRRPVATRLRSRQPPARGRTVRCRP
ncbi:LysE/ArgO family amino acid transporter [uncultured Jatrophihabitans sp.]|uniref:LysE/ArgO family amino acid transporter n=1 Tax=uncultured Jatrophihabitans sp. TaxID=1610747 RepID=UPI0035C990AF